MSLSGYGYRYHFMPMGVIATAPGQDPLYEMRDSVTGQVYVVDPQAIQAGGLPLPAFQQLENAGLKAYLSPEDIQSHIPINQGVAQKLQNALTFQRQALGQYTTPQQYNQYYNGL